MLHWLVVPQRARVHLCCSGWTSFQGLGELGVMQKNTNEARSWRLVGAKIWPVKDAKTPDKDSRIASRRMRPTSRTQRNQCFESFEQARQESRGSTDWEWLTKIMVMSDVEMYSERQIETLAVIVYPFTGETSSVNLPPAWVSLLAPSVQMFLPLRFALPARNLPRMQSPQH